MVSTVHRVRPGPTLEFIETRGARSGGEFVSVLEASYVLADFVEFPTRRAEGLLAPGSVLQPVHEGIRDTFELLHQHACLRLCDGIDGTAGTNHG